MQNIALSPKVIENLNDTTLCDRQYPGLSVIARSGVPTIFQFKRKVRGTGRVFKKVLGSYPALSIANARILANAYNAQCESGVDPREAAKVAEVNAMTVDAAHDIYMRVQRAGLRKVLKPRTIEDKERLWRVSKPTLTGRALQSITERDLRDIVKAKAESGSKIRANRMAAELKVFFSFCAGLEGEDHGIVLRDDPARRLSGSYYATTSRDRTLTDAEIVLFMRALAEQERVYRRALLLILLTGCRKAEVMEAAANERVGDVWTIPIARYKSNIDHVIPLSPWGVSLMETNSKWVLPSRLVDKPLSKDWINQIAEKCRVRMMELGGSVVEPFRIHDLRRTLRSNTKRLGIDSDTAEAMLGHKRTGLKAIYDRYDMMDEKRVAFAKWEQKLIGLAREGGVADALGVPA